MDDGGEGAKEEGGGEGERVNREELNNAAQSSLFPSSAFCFKVVFSAANFKWQLIRFSTLF